MKPTWVDFPETVEFDEDEDVDNRLVFTIGPSKTAEGSGYTTDHMDIIVYWPDNAPLTGPNGETDAIVYSVSFGENDQLEWGNPS